MGSMSVIREKYAQNDLLFDFEDIQTDISGRLNLNFEVLLFIVAF
jgi:hypothetical protein